MDRLDQWALRKRGRGEYGRPYWGVAGRREVRPGYENGPFDETVETGSLYGKIVNSLGAVDLWEWWLNKLTPEEFSVVWIRARANWWSGPE